MILEPLVLLLIINKVGEEFPVARGIIRAFNHEIVSIVTEIRHGLHADYRVLDVLELLVAQGV